MNHKKRAAATAALMAGFAIPKVRNLVAPGADRALVAARVLREPRS
jgi:hypothetical protein